MEKSCGAIIINKNKVLLIRQKNGDIGFPKGHMESGEQEEETAIREVKEETNVNIIIDKTKRYQTSYFTDKGIYKEVVYFVAKPKGNIHLLPQISEVDKIMWVFKEDVSKYLTHKNLLDIWNKINGMENKYDEKRIKLNKRQYNLFIYLVEKYKKMYADRLRELKEIEEETSEFNYENVVYLIRKHNELVKEFLTSLLDEFKVFKIFKVTIFITGSFARESNKLNSDLDIHFLYNNLFKLNIYKYEELYFLVVANVLGIERNNIHSVITTKLSKRRLNYYDNLKDSTYLKVRMKYKEKLDLEYSFYPVTKKRFYLQYINSKSYHAFKKYISKEILDKNREWAHNFYQITDNKKFDRCIKKLKKSELKNKKITKNIDNIIKNIKLSENNSDDIMQIKKYYQQITFGNIFNTLNIIRWINGKFYMTIPDICKCEILNKFDKSSELERLIYEYLYLVNKVSYYCNKFGIPYSIHISRKVKIDIMNEVREKQNMVNKKLLELLNYIKEEYTWKIEQ